VHVAAAGAAREQGLGFMYLQYRAVRGLCSFLRLTTQDTDGEAAGGSLG
jgi:hypothetical protein